MARTADLSVSVVWMSVKQHMVDSPVLSFLQLFTIVIMLLTERSKSSQVRYIDACLCHKPSQIRGCLPAFS